MKHMRSHIGTAWLSAQSGPNWSPDGSPVYQGNYTEFRRNQTQPACEVKRAHLWLRRSYLLCTGNEYIPATPSRREFSGNRDASPAQRLQCSRYADFLKNL